MTNAKIVPFRKIETEYELCGACNRRMTKKRYLANLNSGKQVILCQYCYDAAKDGSEALKEKVAMVRQNFKKWYHENEGDLPGEVKEAARKHIEKYHN